MFYLPLVVIFSSLFFANVASICPIYVATNGSDSEGNGTVINPFSSPSHAQKVLRVTSCKIALFFPGVYYLSSTLALTALDDHTTFAAAPTNETNQNVVFSGGRVLPLSTYQYVQDPSVISQLNPATVKEVIMVDLRKDIDLDDFGSFSTRGSPNADAHLEMHPPMIAASGLELFWLLPNDPYDSGHDVDMRADFAAFPPGASGANLLFSEVGPLNEEGRSPQFPGFQLVGAAINRSKAWIQQLSAGESADVWGHGFWHVRWADAHYPVYSLIMSNSTFNTTLYMKTDLIPIGPRNCAKTVCCGDCKINQVGANYFLYNLLAELDQPGEVYLNRTSGKIYFIPPVTSTSVPTAVVSVLKHIITVDNAKGILVNGITLKHSRGIAFRISNAINLTMIGGGVAAVGSTAINATGMNSRNIVLDSITVKHTGDSGIVLDGGDRTSLRSSNHILKNSFVSDTNYYVWSNAPNVFIGGVGQTVMTSELFKSTHQAIWVQGNDHVIYKNDIHDVLQQTTDSGAVYAGRDWTYRGNQVVFNMFHDVRSHLGEDTSAVYMDDCMCGFNISYNTFVNVSRTLLVGGGRDNIFKGNTIEGTHNNPIHFDARCINNQSRSTQLKRLGNVPYNTSKAWAKYGDRMINILKEDPGIPSGNIFSFNTFFNSIQPSSDVTPTDIGHYKSVWTNNTDVK